MAPIDRSLINPYDLPEISIRLVPGGLDFIATVTRTPEYVSADVPITLRLYAPYPPSGQGDIIATMGQLAEYVKTHAEVSDHA